MRLVAAAAGVALLLAGCAAPPPEAYVRGTTGPVQGVAIGRDASNETCVQQARTAGGTVDVFCGTWQQPSATVVRIGPGGPGALAGLVASGPWRNGLDARFVCAAPQATTVLNEPALVMTCTRRIGGWPQIALATSIGGQVYAADGIDPALPVINRAIGVLAGRVTPQAASSSPRSGVEALFASRLAAQTFSAGDVGQYDDLIVAGTRANLAESYAAAEEAYRAALALQRKAVGGTSPDQADTLALIALQLSNQGRFAEADALFDEAQRLSPRAGDAATRARVTHYRALNELNQFHNEAALTLLQQGEADYAALLPPEALRSKFRISSPFVLGRAGTGLVNNPVPNDNVIVDKAEQSALLGLIETRRYQSIVLRDMGRPAESEAAIRRGADLAASQGMRQPVMTARLLRTAATIAASSDDAVSGLGLSSIAFGQALPGTRPVASTELLRAARLAHDNRTDAALAACRRAGTVLRDLKAGAPPALVEPCLAIYADAASGSDAQSVLAEMFEAAQQGQGSITTQQIANSTARLRENARDPRVGEAIRRRQLAGDTLAELIRERDAAALRNSGSYVPGDPRARSAADLDTELTKARAQVADADAALQAASPNFGQLVQQVVSAADVFAALRPGEAFVSIALGRESGWVFLLRDGSITAHRVGTTSADIKLLVDRFRRSVQLGDHGLPEFDSDAAHRLFAVTLGQVGAPLAGAKQIVIAPTGPLLSIPFAALLTEPAGRTLADAPWLIRQAAISHVPAAANFVSLRRIAGTSRATRPWFGLGNFQPVTLAQAERTFPGAACAESAKLFAGLSRLPFAGRELEAARALLGGSTQDELEGAAYTAPNVERARLKDYRILHFASHALLPAELKCAQEPAIVTSAVPGATTGSGALLSASAISAMDLDADMVILSACNSAGPNGPAGESLSGLARAFFYAGARSMLVTHWSVNDQISAFLVADALRRLKQVQEGGLADALRGAELGLLAEAGKAMPSELAHPFYWAPFALIGDGGTASPSAGL